MRVTRSVIPNLFTLANLFCGVAAIVASFEGRTQEAIGLIITAGVFDMLDGVVARLTRSTSEFGVELDSLCDAVSFGVAPSILLYVSHPASQHASQWTLIISSIPALAGVLRLARFNVQLTSMEDKLYFRGMPIPAGAFLILSYLAVWHARVPAEWQSQAITAVSIITGLAMVSTIKYDNLPRPSIKAFRQRPIVFSVFFVGTVFCLVTKLEAMFPFMMLYLIGGALRHAFIFVRDRTDRDDSIDEGDPDPFTM
ncbi:MAG: Phosphatidylserine synthase [Bacteroidota bacterium]|jgi:CDP-diacylglycerol--serine O-phosphatidyltransferase